MRLSPIVQSYSMNDWLCDVVFACKGKQWKRTLATHARFSEGEAIDRIRRSLCTGRRSLPEGNPYARPAITIIDLKIYRRYLHPRFRSNTQSLSATELLAKG